MKIAVNSRLYQRQNAGIPYYIKSLYQTLMAMYPDYKFVFFQTDDAKTLGDTKTVKPNSPGKSKLLFDLIWAHLLLQREKDVSVFHGAAGIIPLIKKPGVRYVITIHDLAFELFPQNNGWLFYWYYHFSMKSSARRADAIIAVSENTKLDIIRLYKVKPDKIRVIYSGNNTFLKPQQPERIIRGKYFFSLTTHPKRKNIVSVVKAMAKSRENWANVIYVIAGIMRDEDRRDLEKIISEMGLIQKVQIFGYATEEQLANLYQYAEFFIYPSFYEGFGQPILEAMSCRCPVIASNTSSMKELMPEKEWLLDPKNIESIIQKMSQLMNLSKPRRMALIENNYIFAKAFSWERSAHHTNAAFREA
jgi:glycosyltransferase involved in cell wall biosynthesis